MKKVIYTCITGNYDEIKKPIYIYIEPDCDYICFTNNKQLTSDFWDIRYINDESLSNVKLARKVKILYHEYLPEYDETIWVDGNVSIQTSINEFKSNIKLNEMPFAISKHPVRDCIYDEINGILVE